MNEISEPQRALTGGSELLDPISIVSNGLWLRHRENCGLVKHYHICSNGHVFFLCPASLVLGMHSAPNSLIFT